MLHSCPRSLSVLQDRSSQGGDNRRREGFRDRSAEQQDWGGRKPSGGGTFHRAALCRVSPLTDARPSQVPLPQSPRPQHPATPPLSQAVRAGASSGRHINNRPAQRRGTACASPQPSMPPPRGPQSRAPEKEQQVQLLAAGPALPTAVFPSTLVTGATCLPSRLCAPFPSKADELQAARRDMRGRTEGRPRGTRLPASSKLSGFPSSAGRGPILNPRPSALLAASS